MISVFLQGGLGNQLFQVAAAKSLALDLNDDFAINHDICYTPNQGQKSGKYKNTFFKNIKETKFIPNLLYKEPEYIYNEIPKVKNITIHGYFQSEKYFRKHKQEIIKDYTLDQSWFNEINEWKKSNKINRKTVGVHVRRGDYLKFSHHHKTNALEYYIEAFKHFENVDFVIVSDDMEWVKQNIIGDNIYYSDFYDEIKDFCLLTSCDHNINTNSTFSWWASYLNKNINKKIYVPSEWYTKEADCDIKDLIPEKWIKI
jgi:hypothetical protein